MREESHLDDMRSAIRGDFERLAERRGGQELMREPEPVPESESESESKPDLEPESEVPEPVPEPISEAEPDPALVVEPPGAAEPGPTPEQELEAEPTSDEGLPDESAPRRSFLDRLLDR